MKTYQLVGEIADFDYVSETYGFRICGPASLKRFLAECDDGERVEIEINSPGGLCVPGMEMANAIKNSKAHVVAHVTGMAASMASVIACACDEIKMEEAAFMMIHDPWSGIEGNAAAMRKEAQNLDQFKAVIMSFYRGKFNRTPEELSALMSDETWMTGAECVENGLKCELIKSDVQIAALVGTAHFGKMPEAAAKLYQSLELTDDAKAELAKAKEKAKGEESAKGEGQGEEKAKDEGQGQGEEKAKGEGQGQESAKGEGQGQESAKGEGQGEERSDSSVGPTPLALGPSPTPSALGPSPSAAAEGNWEARFKGASKKINELQAKLEKAEADLSGAQSDKTELAAAQATINDLQGKLDQSEKALADANASVSKLTAELEKVKKDLAQMGERANHLAEVNATITGNVLIPSDAAETYEAKMAAAIKSGTVNDRMALRKQKAAGKIK